MHLSSNAKASVGAMTVTLDKRACPHKILVAGCADGCQHFPAGEGPNAFGYSSDTSLPLAKSLARLILFGKVTPFNGSIIEADGGCGSNAVRLALRVKTEKITLWQSRSIRRGLPLRAQLMSGSP